MVDDASLPLSKLNLGAGGISGAGITDRTLPGVKLVLDSITALEIAPSAITTSEIAPSAVTEAKIATDAVTADKIPAASLDRGLDKTSGAIGHTNLVTPGTNSGITFDEEGHIVSAVPLVPSDLPLATESGVGAVSVPISSGLVVSGVGALGHANSVIPGTVSGISHDEQGHITNIAPLVADDLPLATETTVGAVSILPGPGLHVAATGELSHTNSGIAAGTYPKVVVDVRGHVTAGLMLIASDIPSLDASKITSGTLGTGQIADHSITQEKLDDYSISFIQEQAPTPTKIYHHGMLWLQESTGQLRMWNGNSWFPVGFGRLSAENLRYCGTFDASTGKITGLTQFGTTEGFKIGDPIPAATDTHSGVYFVCTVDGNLTPVLLSTAFDNGDWILCNGLRGGWVRVDTTGGSGSGAVTHLDDLLDVGLSIPAVGDRLVYGAGNQWTNDRPATQGEVDAGVDVIKIVTPKTLQNATINCGIY